MKYNLIDRVNRFIHRIVGRKKEPWYKYYSNNDKINYPNLTIYGLLEITALTYPYSNIS